MYRRISTLDPGSGLAGPRSACIIGWVAAVAVGWSWAGAPAFGQTYWTGNGNFNFNNDANWSSSADGSTGGTVPSNSTTAVFSASARTLRTDVALTNESNVAGIEFNATGVATGGTTIRSSGGPYVLNLRGSGNLISLGADSPAVTLGTGSGSIVAGALNLRVYNSGTFVNNSASSLTIVSSLERAANQTVNRTITIDGTGETVISAAVNNGGTSGVLRLAKTGSGRLTLSGSNGMGSGTLAFGGANVDAGSIRLTNNAALGSYTTVDLNGAVAGISRLELSGGVTISDKSITTAGRNNATTTGAILQNIAGDNTWAGTITIDDGGGTYGFVSDAGTLTLSGTLTSSWDTANAARLLRFAGAGDILVSGTIEPGIGSGTSLDLSVDKFGAGVLTLSGTNTYTGSTTVNEGTLRVNGSIATSGTTTVASGGTLGGSGSVGATVISGGGFHSPGTSPGIQTFSNGLEYAASSTLVWELFDNTSADRGTAYDGIDLTGGTLTIDPAAILALDFGTTAGGSLVDWDNAFWNSDQSWTVIDVSASGSWDEGLFGLLTVGNDTQGRSLASVRPNASFSVAADNGDLTLQYVAVPEPRIPVAAVLGSMLVACSRLLRRPRPGFAI